MPFGVLDFIDADSVDLAERPVFQSPGNDMLDRIENLFPGSAKGFGRFLARKSSRSAGQEQYVGLGQGTLTAAPRNFLDHNDVAVPAVDAPHGVEQEDKIPKVG